MWAGSSVISSSISLISVIIPQVPHLIWHWFIYGCLPCYKQLFPTFFPLIFLLFTFVSSIIIQSDATQPCLPVISPNVALLCSTTCASFISPLRLPSVPPSLCPFIHPYIFLGQLLRLVRRLMCSASQENGTHYFWLSTSSPNYSLILYISHFHISFVFPLTGPPAYVCLSVPWPDTQKPAFQTYFTDFRAARYAEAHFHESTAHGTSAVNDSRGTWHNNYNTVGDGTVTEPGLQPDQSNPVFFLLLKIALSVPGHPDHLVIEKSKAALPQTLPLRGNACRRFS